jgi:hypothetical protein
MRLTIFTNRATKTSLQMERRPNYIIYSSSYDENVGGSIVLHKLCHVLNQLGEHAYLWPRKKKRYDLRWVLKRKNFEMCASFNTPFASSKHLKNSIVVYPEIVSGNPLQAKNVVRWFLHRPGYHTGKINYGENELYFSFDEASDDSAINTNPDNRLTILSLNPAYKNQNRGGRFGSCYMMRKGEGRLLIHDVENSIRLDGMSHREIADVFNRTKIFYSYDEFTMYSQFAALCGCISVVIPASYKNRLEWVGKHPISKYGIAYGLDDIEHARETQYLVLEYFKDQERESMNTVKSFVSKTCNYFGFIRDDNVWIEK